VALSLKSMGYTKAVALRGGWNEWNGAGYPVEKK